MPTDPAKPLQIQARNLEQPNELQTDPGFDADDPAGADAGESLAALKLHYLTLGKPRRDASGAIANGVLLLHGTAGSAADLVQAGFFASLYGAGEPLDLSCYFLVIHDAIGA